ncbi:MAG: Gldg family protein [Myxococcales bacterium]|nr:Gldg family protein [Myxococcales bacterium]MCB9530897.1 Gldg family protein [Myxococcales bacterium]
MNAILTVMRKELRGLFQSPVAMIFLGAFLLATHFAFFTAERFFARDLADVRPLFQWLPMLLVFLVSAVTMRMWAEERKMGTLELLQTLPLETHQLVFGKFAASVGLVKIALLLTLPLPLMVGSMGDLDWGPVIGGYFGAVLLGAAYSAVGLAISARTDNQVVALMLTMLVCAALYVVGSPTVVDLVGGQTGDILRALGTGSRFESIGRGVIDLRDLVYYLGIVVVALSINVLSLESDRVDAGSAAGRKSLVRLRATTLLIAANVVALNAWLAPVSAVRADLTADKEYSLSPVTKDTLARLGEPLIIEGYFSERTHPLLAPLVPQIRDVLSEYEIAGRGRVRVSFADPNTDEDLEARIQEDYGVRSMPFRVADRTQQAVVNAFFHVVVRYGDQYQVLSFDDLIEVRMDDADVDVRLRNLEYDLTRAIRRVSQNFQTTDSLLAALPQGAKITLVASANIPADLAAAVESVRTVATDLASKSDRLEFAEVDPTGDAGLQQQLQDRYNIRPLATDILATDTFFLDVIVELGDHVERVVPRGDLSEAEARAALEASIRRLTPGQLTTVALFTREPEQPEYNPNIPPQYQPQPEPPDYRYLEQLLSERFQVRRTTLSEGEVPGDVDVLVVAKPGDLTDEQKFAVDQFLMRGGSVIALAGRYEVKPSQTGLESSRSSGGLQDLLASYGVTVADGLVFDPQNAAFPIPVQERRGGVVLQRIEFMDYPMFPDVRSDGFDRSHPAASGLAGVTTPWASPLTLDPPEGVVATPLLQTSERSWAQANPEINPDPQQFPETGFPTESVATSRSVVAATLTGTFPSYFADRPAPGFAGEGSGDGTGRTLTRSLPTARLAVVGSAEAVSDLMMSIAQQPGGEVHRGNVQLVENLLDWSTEDTELLEIRSSGAFARTLVPLDDGVAQKWEYGQQVGGLLLVVILSVIPWYRRRATKPFAAAPSTKVQA